jgi:transcription elongation factor GreA
MPQVSTRGAALCERASEAVNIGAVVRLQDLIEESEWEVTIVDTFSADPESGRISNECPIGEALIGRQAGEMIEVEVPAGVERYKVVSVQFPSNGGKPL